MKKILFNDKPTVNKRGHYSFQDTMRDAYEQSDSLPIRFDKFSDNDLYTTVHENGINKVIVDSELRYSGESFFEIKRMNVRNSGIDGKINNIHVYGFMFDRDKWDYHVGASVDPMTAGYSTLFNFFHPTANTLRPEVVYYSQTFGDRGEGDSLGNVIDEKKVFTSLKHSSVEPIIEGFPGNQTQFNPSSAFRYTSPDGAASNLPGDHIFEPTINHKWYIATFAQGDHKHRNTPTDHRAKRIQVWSLTTNDLWNLVGDTAFGKEEEFELLYGDSHIVEAGGGASYSSRAPAWMIDITLRINTTEGEVQTGLTSFESQATGSVQSPIELSINNYDQSFLKQNPFREIKLFSMLPSEINKGEHSTLQQYYNSIKTNFEPLTSITIKNDDTKSVEMYYSSSIDSQIRSAPTQIDFTINPAEYNTTGQDYELVPKDIGNDIDYKFYVIDWNDFDNKFREFENAIEDVPIDFFELIEKREQNLYKFANSGEKLTHHYSSPGMKIIKSVLFTYPKNNSLQAIRWKLVTSRIFLDIPVSQYPDFAEVGGSHFTTLPWPYTTAIIGGVSDNSQYKTSITNTLSGGKIAKTDIIDEKFLNEAKENDEQGQSILNFDLEQTRYFNSSYDMNTLLGIENEITTDGTDFYPFTSSSYWDCNDWDGDRNKCFSDETSVGEIFISDNSDKTLNESCYLELNVGDLDGKSIIDSSGNTNKGILIGDYKVSKPQKNKSTRRDSYIQLPKKQGNQNGAL